MLHDEYYWERELGPAIEKAEELQRDGSEITGIPTGYRDLDRKLAGLHPTNLIIKTEPYSSWPV